MDLSREKMRVTPTHVYFWGGPFSQWWRKSSFTAEIPVLKTTDGVRRIVRSGEVLVFSSAEKYMMASKASVFGDAGVLADIMKIHDVRAIKALGRKVKGLAGGDWDAADKALWDAVDMIAVTIGSYSKFTQDDGMYDVMVSMAGRTFVEGSPHDRIWGVGLAWDNPAIEDPANWLGPNKLGRCLDTSARLIEEHGRHADAWKVVAAMRRAAAAPEPVAPPPSRPAFPG